MIGLCFYYEPQYIDEYSGFELMLHFWRLTGKAYNVKDFSIISEIDVPDLHDESINISVYKTFEEFENSVEGNIVKLSGVGGTSLYVPEGFTWYCFGPAQGFPPNKEDVKLDYPNDNNLHAVQVLPRLLHEVNSCRSH